MFYHSFSNAPKAISRTKFKQGKVCGKRQPHRRVLARRVPRTGLPTVPLSGALWGFYTHSNIPERGRGRGRDVPLWDGEGWLWKERQKEERGPGEGRSQTNRFQERVHMWGQKSGNLILLKLPTPAYSMESLCASPELCIFQCQVTWVSRLCERLKRQYTGDRTGFHSLAASPGLITASLNVGFLPVKGNCLAQRVTVRIKRHHACKAHLMSTWEAFDKWQLWLLPLLLLLLLFLRLLITICQGRALSYASHWFSSLLPVRIQISNEKREQGRQKAPEK